MSNIKANIKKFDLDKALDTIDLSFSNYSPTEDALEFFVLMRLVQGEDFEFTTPKFHFWLVDLMFGNITRDQYPYSKEVRDTITINAKRICIVASRGLAKSTIVTAFYPVYCAIKGKTPDGNKTEFHLLVAASQQGGGRVMAKAVQSLCDDSLFCNNYFESMRFTETESEFIRKGEGKMKNRVFLARYIGIGGGIRGVRSNIGAERPDHIIFDDVILNSDTAHSETIMTSLRTTIKADAINALKGGGKGKIFSVATPFHLLDPIIEMLTGGAYTPVAIPICENIKEGMSKEEFVGAWESMHPYEAVIEQYESSIASNATREFNQERMLRISSEEDRMIPDKLIQWVDRELIVKSLQGYSLYITTDFTTTSEAKSDFSALGVWAINSNNDWFLLDVCVRRQGIGEQYDELFRMVRTWSNKGAVLEVGIEVDGQQKAHLYALKEEMTKRNTFFTFARQKGAKYGSQGILSKSVGGNKHARFRMVLPQFQNLKIFFAEQLKDTPDMKEALTQLKHTSWYGFSSHDDFPDIVSMVSAMEVILPMAVEDYRASDQKDGIFSFMYDDDQNISPYASYS